MNDKDWKIQFELFELQDKIEMLETKNKELHNENKHFQLSKAYKIWQKFAAKDLSKCIEPKYLNDIKVALIADEFTYNSFKHEFVPITITPKNWFEKFEKEKPDIFFCESAWVGFDEEGSKDPWRGKIYKFYSKKENRKDLLNIIEYCRNHSIPTVFWNKEDPPHYRTEKYSYAETANEFDYVFTTSEKCIAHYKKDFNHPHVNSLMFAGQPKLFNPLSLSDEKINQVVFAGTYYTNHPKRTELMDMIFDMIIEQSGDLLIFDREYYRDGFNYPERFLKFTRPPITYEETAEVYKKMDWGLNFNIITDSNTMFARRVFELALSNVNILTNYSKGVEKIFKDNIFVFDEMDQLPDFTKSYEEKRLNNLYNVLENHTYTKRWMEILDTIGYEYKVQKNDVTLIFKLDNADDIEKIIEKFESIDYDDKVLKIVVESKDIELDFKNKYPQISDVYRDINNLKKDIRTEFWILADLNIGDDFIRHAILHYQYINKRLSIKSGKDKFKLTVDSDIANKVINKKNLHYLDEEDLEVYTYSI